MLLGLWFDVGIKRYTTNSNINALFHKLWFDVGIKRYTTTKLSSVSKTKLWFDVGIKRYTTGEVIIIPAHSCGLM